MPNCRLQHISKLLLKTVFLSAFLLCCTTLFSQKKSATLTGKVVDEDDRPLSKVSVTVLGRQTGTITSDSGTFVLKAPAEKAFAVVFSYTGYKTAQKNFLLSENEREFLIVKLDHARGELESVTVTDQRQRTEAGLITINPKKRHQYPVAYRRSGKSY